MLPPSWVFFVENEGLIYSTKVAHPPLRSLNRTRGCFGTVALGIRSKKANTESDRNRGEQTDGIHSMESALVCRNLLPCPSVERVQNRQDVSNKTCLLINTTGCLLCLTLMFWTFIDLLKVLQFSSITVLEITHCKPSFTINRSRMQPRMQAPFPCIFLSIILPSFLIILSCYCHSFGPGQCQSLRHNWQAVVNS